PFRTRAFNGSIASKHSIAAPAGEPDAHGKCPLPILIAVGRPITPWDLFRRPPRGSLPLVAERRRWPEIEWIPLYLQKRAIRSEPWTTCIPSGSKKARPSATRRRERSSD